MRNKLVIIGIVLLAIVLSYLVVIGGGDSKEDALNEARNFQPTQDSVCTQALTPAVHEETGATYTFPNGCLPTGWVAHQ